MNKSNYVSISRVAQRLNVSNMTIIRWYRWWEDDTYDKPHGLSLPQYVYLDRRKTKYFHINSIPMLEEFQAKINTTHKGAMAGWNATHLWNKDQRAKREQTNGGK